MHWVSNIEDRVGVDIFRNVSFINSRLAVKRVNFVQELILCLVSLGFKLLVDRVVILGLFVVSSGRDFLLSLDIVSIIHVDDLFVHEVGSLSAEADWMTTIFGLTVWVWLGWLLNWLIFLFFLYLLLLTSVWIVVCRLLLAV